MSQNSARGGSGWRREVGRGWPVLIATVLGGALGAGVFTSFPLGFFMAPLEAEFGWSRAAIGLASSVFLAGMLILLPVVGWLCDRFGPRLVAITAIVSSSAVYAALPFVVTSEIWTLYAGYFAVALGGAGTSFVVYSRTINAWFTDARGFALGVMIAGPGVATALVPFILPPLMEAYGWRAGYLAISGIVLLALPLVVPLLRDPPERQAAVAVGGHEALGGIAMPEILRTRAFWTMAVAVVLGSAALAASIVHLVPMYRDMGASSLQTQFAVSALGVSMIVSRPLVGFLLDRLHPPAVAAACLAMTALALAIASNMGPGFILIFAIALGLGLSAEGDVLAFLCSRFFGLRAYGAAYGWLYAAATLGYVAGPVLAGIAYTSHGGYDLARQIAAGLCIVSAALIFSLGLGDSRAPLGLRPKRT
ncbi:MAG: MFS transporter [Phenylobacterium sp.]|uniref:MFS transporter n=1 Tax=Phenylobacterium sp. TaxID=1871053 RepID=UPI002734FD5E|nr:MFS transporter [Phenylobacterium sp.]MDP3750005.1 MFS transporter [Phenylobacterium sp.]